MAMTRYRQVLEQLDDGVFFTTLAGVVTDCNAGAEGLCGVARGEIIGQLLGHFHVGPGLSALMLPRGDADADAGGSLAEVSIARPDGQTRRCTAKVATLCDDGKESGFVCIYRELDCTGFGQRNHTDPDPKLGRRCAAGDRALEPARLRLQPPAREGIAQERRRAIGEVANGIAHNLNNMLSPSVILIDLLQAEPGLSARAQALIKTIETSIHDTSDLVGQLGLLCRNADAERKWEAVDLRALIEAIPALTCAKWRHEARRVGREIDLALQLEDVPAMCGNTADLRQCLTNLVFNAVDAMTHGGTIILRLRNEDGVIVVTVQDCGRGMTAAEQNKCLEPFFTAKPSGMGLGLSLCAGIVAEHRGTLQVESVPCEGTSIHLRFPVESCSTPSSIDAFTSEASCSASSYRILYIDDEPLVRKSMALLLDNLGHQVDLAENGFAGIEKFEQQSYDVVISDYSMPGCSGREVAAAVKAIKPGIVVLLVTGWSASQLAPGAGEQALEDGIIQKPMTIDKLRAALGKAMPS